jgi:hypothetical protein
MDRVSQDNRALTIRPSGQTGPSASLMSGIDDKLAERVMAAGMKQGPVYSQTQMWAQLGTAAIGGIFKGMAAEKKGEILQRLSASMEGANIDPQDKREIDGLLKAGYVSLAVNKSDQAKRLKAAAKERRTLKEQRFKEAQARKKFDIEQAKKRREERRTEARRLREERIEEAWMRKQERLDEAEDLRQARLAEARIKYDRERRDKLADEKVERNIAGQKAIVIAGLKKATTVVAGEMSMRKEWERNSRGARDQIEAYANIEVNRNVKNSASDFAMIKQFNRLIEKGGRISDEDFKQAARIGTVVDRVKVYWSQWVTSRKLLDSQRQEIMIASKASVTGTMRTVDRMRTWYKNLIADRGYDEKHILIPTGRGPGAPTQKDRDRLRELLRLEAGGK